MIVFKLTFYSVDYNMCSVNKYGDYILKRKTKHINFNTQILCLQVSF